MRKGNDYCDISGAIGSQDGLRTVNLIKNTLVECNVRGDTTKLNGHRMVNASRLNGGW